MVVPGGGGGAEQQRGHCNSVLNIQNKRGCCCRCRCCRCCRGCGCGCGCRCRCRYRCRCGGGGGRRRRPPPPPRQGRDLWWLCPPLQAFVASVWRLSPICSQLSSYWSPCFCLPLVRCVRKFWFSFISLPSLLLGSGWPGWDGGFGLFCVCCYLLSLAFLLLLASWCLCYAWQHCSGPCWRTLTVDSTQV